MITFGGNDISAITVDGNDIQYVTIGGVDVWTAVQGTDPDAFIFTLTTTGADTFTFPVSAFTGTVQIDDESPVSYTAEAVTLNLATAGTYRITVTGAEGALNSWDIHGSANRLLIKSIEQTGVLFTSLGSQAFEDCENLKFAKLDGSLIILGLYAFRYCDHLQTVVLGANVTTISNDAFTNCANLIHMYADSPLTIGTSLSGTSDVLTIHLRPSPNTPTGWVEGVNQSIAGNNYVEVAFDWTGYPDATYGTGTLEPFIFTLNSTSFNFPVSHFTGTVQINSDTPVEYDYEPVTLTLPAGINTVTVTGSRGQLNNWYINSNSERNKITTITQTGSLFTRIGMDAFDNCDYLTDVTITQASTIGDRAFISNGKLANLSVPEGLKYVGVSAFVSCLKLKDFIIPSTLVELAYQAFYNCDALTTFNCPSGMKILGEQSLYQCSALSTVTLNEGLEVIGANAFRETAITSITIPSTVTTLLNSTFQTCLSLTSVTISSSVTSLGNYCFYNCDALQSIVIPDSVQTIGTHCFNGSGNLTTVTLPSGLVEIPTLAFSATPVSSINWPTTLKTIGSQAFRNCQGLTSVKLPNGLETLSSYAFDGCENITEMVIYDSVTTIQSVAMRGMDNLQTLYVDVPLSTFNASSMSGNSNITIRLRPSPNTPAGWVIGAGQSIGGATNVTVVADWTTWPSTSAL